MSESLDELIDRLPMKRRRPTPPGFISVEEAGRRFDLNRMAAYGAVWRGQIPSIRIGNRLLVPVAALNEIAPPLDDDKPQQREANGEAA